MCVCVCVCVHTYTLTQTHVQIRFLLHREPSLWVLISFSDTIWGFHENHTKRNCAVAKCPVSEYKSL